MNIKSDNRIILRDIDKFFLVWFLISFFHSILGFLFYVSLIIYFIFGAEGGLKSLIFATTRGVLSSAVAAIPAFQIVKLAIMLASAVWILFQTNMTKHSPKEYEEVCLGLLIFGCSILLSSLFVCSYPTTSLFKALSFALCFLATIKAVGVTAKQVNWNDFLLVLYGMLFLISLFLIPFSRFRITNEDFQGVFNHVNIFGIISALFVAIILQSKFLDKYLWMRLTALILTIVMEYLSASRTGMFSIIAILITYLLFSKKIDDRVKWGIFGLSILFVIIFILIPSIGQQMFEFIYKGQDGIWDSRSEILENSIKRWQTSPILGTGFMVPYVKNYFSLTLNMNMIIEPSNLLWMLLGDLGILGVVSFVFLFYIILKNGKKESLFLLVSAFMVCMGEMVFFSPNNMSILIYVLLALYLFEKEDLCSCN